MAWHVCMKWLPEWAEYEQLEIWLRVWYSKA